MSHGPIVENILGPLSYQALQEGSLRDRFHVVGVILIHRDKNSFCKTRTPAGENVPCCVDVAVMRRATS